MSSQTLTTPSLSAEDRRLFLELERRGLLGKVEKSTCLWPKPYSEDTPAALWEFVKLQYTWDEPAKRAKQFPELECLRFYVEKWWECRSQGRPLITEKCRRMVVSWCARACELWAMGLQRSDQTLAGEDLEAAAKHVWRLKYLYDGLRENHKDWKLQEATHTTYRGKWLSSFTLPNGSLCQYGNGQANSLQGEGTSIITMEEPGIYPYLSGMLAQARIICKGDPDDPSPGGFINLITNASFLKDWQDIKKPLRDGRSGLTEAITGVELADLPDGALYLKMHYYADRRKGEEWLAEMRAEMTATPTTYRLQILMDDAKVEGALITRELIEKTRVSKIREDCIVKRLIAIDPSIKDPAKAKNPNKEPDECGIVVGSLAMLDGVPHVYLEFDWSGVYSPAKWAEIAKKGAKKLQWGKKDPLTNGYLRSPMPVNGIVYEENQGGDLVAEVLRDHDQFELLEIPIWGVHASVGKRPRAEPVAALWEKLRIHIVGHLPQLETEWCTWDASHPGQLSPGRIDASVWLVHALGLATSQEIRSAGSLEPRKRAS